MKNRKNLLKNGKNLTSEKGKIMRVSNFYEGDDGDCKCRLFKFLSIECEIQYLQKYGRVLVIFERPKYFFMNLKKV
jgi:hypothetical protein